MVAGVIAVAAVALCRCALLLLSGLALFDSDLKITKLFAIHINSYRWEQRVACACPTAKMRVLPLFLDFKFNLFLWPARICSVFPVRTFMCSFSKSETGAVGKKDFFVATSIGLEYR